MIPTEWLGHRRASDGELVGYLVPGPGSSWTPVTVLGLPVPGAGAMDLDDAERCLDETGLSALADRWTLDLPELAEPIAVQIREVTPAGVGVVSVDFGSAVEYGTRFHFDVPVTVALTHGSTRPGGAALPNHCRRGCAIGFSVQH